MSTNQDKYYFMGCWFPVNEVKQKLLNITKLPEDELTSSEEISDVIERLVKDRPSSFSVFCREMHTLRFGARNDTLRSNN